MVEARDRTGLKIVEAFMVRFHPQWKRTRELVRSGRIGEVRTIQSAFLFTALDPRNVRNQVEIGGGALYDVGCYPIVTARYVYEAEPDRVIGLVNRDPQMGVDRWTSGVLSFPGGGHLVFSTALQLASYQRVVILGSAGRIELHVPFTPQKDHSCRILIDTGKSQDGSSAEIENFAPVDQYMLQCDLAAKVFRALAEARIPYAIATASYRPVIDSSLDAVIAVVVLNAAEIRD